MAVDPSGVLALPRSASRGERRGIGELGLGHHYVLIGILGLLYAASLALAFFAPGRRSAWMVALLTVPLGAIAIYLVAHGAFGHGAAAGDHDIEQLIAVALVASGLLICIVLRK